jgi:hypothetical protein
MSYNPLSEFTDEQIEAELRRRDHLGAALISWWSQLDNDERALLGLTDPAGTGQRPDDDDGWSQSNG